LNSISVRTGGRPEIGLGLLRLEEGLDGVVDKKSLCILQEVDQQNGNDDCAQQVPQTNLPVRFSLQNNPSPSCRKGCNRKQRKIQAGLNQVCHPVAEYTQCQGSWQEQNGKNPGGEMFAQQDQPWQSQEQQQRSRVGRKTSGGIHTSKRDGKRQKQAFPDINSCISKIGSLQAGGREKRCG